MEALGWLSFLVFGPEFTGSLPSPGHLEAPEETGASGEETSFLWNFYLFSPQNIKIIPTGMWKQLEGLPVGTFPLFLFLFVCFFNLA